ncbi:MAG: hypothetical protein B6D53_01130 [Candidatus Omnitrophica bacterium 4484_49]|nr:hypothetical protein [Candidatus Omnitrophota bacterium]OQX83979.1 MAG: hypothetical protein B6D53_01130 [Candidatus Omnitrophica bacterium 4484_49]
MFRNVFNFLKVFIITLIVINLTRLHPLYARRILDRTAIIQITKDLEKNFGVNSWELPLLLTAVENLRVAVEDDDGLFRYYITQIQELSTKNVVVNFINCIAVVRKRENVELVFNLIKEFRRLKARDYFINGILEDIHHLPQELNDIEDGFSILLHALITVTKSTLEEDYQPQAYNFLRRFREEIISKQWINYEYIKKHFPQVMETVIDITTRNLETDMWNALTQINICLNEAKGNWPQAKYLLDKFYSSK